MKKDSRQCKQNCLLPRSLKSIRIDMGLTIDIFGNLGARSFSHNLNLLLEIIYENYFDIDNFLIIAWKPLLSVAKLGNYIILI